MQAAAPHCGRDWTAAGDDQPACWNGLSGESLGKQFRESGRQSGTHRTTDTRREQLRREVEAAGRHVAEAQETGRIDTAWKAEDCRAKGQDGSSTTRVYTGCDGVMVPVVTEAEKLKRRETIKTKRRRCGQKRKPLPPRRRGADQA